MLPALLFLLVAAAAPANAFFSSGACCNFESGACANNKLSIFCLPIFTPLTFHKNKNCNEIQCGPQYCPTDIQCGEDEICTEGVCVVVDRTDKVYETRARGDGSLIIAGQAEDWSAVCHHKNNKVFETVADSEACGGEVIRVDDGVIEDSVQQLDDVAPFADYRLDVSEAGTYWLYVKAQGNNLVDNSFYVELVDEDVVHGYGPTGSGTREYWVFRLLNLASSSPTWYDTAIATNINDDVNLIRRAKIDFATAGAHTLRIANRESGTRVDAWALIKGPQDAGPDACPPSTCIGEPPLEPPCTTVTALCSQSDLDVVAESDGKCAEIVWTDDRR